MGISRISPSSSGKCSYPTMCHPASLLDDFVASGSVTENSRNTNFGSQHHDLSNSINQNYDFITNNNSFEDEIVSQSLQDEMTVDVLKIADKSMKFIPCSPPGSLNGFSHSVTTKTNHRLEGGQESSQGTLTLLDLKEQKQWQNFQQTSPGEPDRIHKYKEELKKQRKEEELKLQTNQKFLKTSLTKSTKLYSLENSGSKGHTPMGFVNTAFNNDCDEDDEDVNDNINIQDSEIMSHDKTEEKHLKKSIDVKDLFMNLHIIRNKLTEPTDQKFVSLVRSLFLCEQFQQAVYLHNQLTDLTSKSFLLRPVMDDVQEFCAEFYHCSRSCSHSVQTEELLCILKKPHFKSLLQAHGAITQQLKQLYESVSVQMQPTNRSQHYKNGVRRTVYIEKTHEHLGATVKNEGDSVIIGRIVKGGAAEKSGELHEGDEILEVNGVEMRGRNIHDISEMLANMSGTITLTIIPGCQSSSESVTGTNRVTHLRALFSYEPDNDPYIPCPELGISFTKGDILHAIALDDVNWWQAYREGEEEDQTLAGLIPSKTFIEQQATIKNMLENKNMKRRNRVCTCGRKHRKKRKKSQMNGLSEDNREIPTYEEVVKYYPQPNHKRPIVLTGPPNVGCDELLQRLLIIDPERFGTPMPYTACSPEGVAVQESMYHPISQGEFTMIEQDRFLEFGIHRRNQYGISLDAVLEIIEQGKVCLLRLQPETVKLIRVADIKPYIIFVGPPTLDKLKYVQDQLDTPLEDQLKDIMDQSRKIEEVYGHLFDFVLVNNNLDEAVRDLLVQINRIETQTQWVPASWLSS